MEIYKVMKYRIYFFLIVFVFMIGGLWASPVKVIVRQPVLPVLTLKEANPVLRLEFVKQASGDCAVREIVCSLKGSTDLTDIEHIVSIRPRACFSPSYNKVKSQTKHVWLLTLL